MVNIGELGRLFGRSDHNSSENPLFMRVLKRTTFLSILMNNGFVVYKTGIYSILIGWTRENSKK